MRAGYCHYHKYDLTVRQMRLHGCLRKKGAWCKRFEPDLNHEWWKARLEKGRSKEAVAPFLERMKEVNDDRQN